MKRLFAILLTLFSLSCFQLEAQTVYQDLQKRSIYEFLDEMTNLHLIELNTLTQPYSRSLIAQKLEGLDTAQLNKRQKEELHFFLKEYKKELLRKDYQEKRKDLFYYADSSFQLTVNPITGGSYSANKSGNYWHRWWGGELFGYLGEHWGFYASLRDQLESDQYLQENFLHRRNGATYKGSGDFSDFRGGLTYQNKKVTVGLIKDLFSWGNHQFGSNVFSTKAPSFTRFNLKLKATDWLELNYFHGWLNSEVLDSSRSYSAGIQQRKILANKFIAANYFSIKPFKKFYFSIGNSIVYSDNFHPAFLIPFAFYKSVDHAIYAGGGNDGGANTQIFMDVSSRNIKGVHLYASLYVDEISFARMWEKDSHSNFVSGKLGAQWSNILNSNLSLSGEATLTNPMAYRHFINTTTFASNQYTLGHYLGDNAMNLAFQLDYRPLARLKCSAGLNLATKGTTNPYTEEGEDVLGLNFQEEIVWRRNQFYTSLRYELINDLYLTARYEYREVSGAQAFLYSPELFQGNTHTFSGSINLGF
ncbi:MAG: hypothetical protein RIC95_13475 [Vicingaceae bacterium]